MNTALENFGVVWDTNDTAAIQNTAVNGVCNNGLKVTALPFSHICRSTCKKIMASETTRKELYVWHKLSNKQGDAKEAAAVEANLWFLKTVNTPRGIDWLTSIASD